MKRLAFLFLILAIGCNPISERKQPIPSLYQLSQMDLKLEGKQLAELYCANCHLKPEPELLERQIWENHVLPDMRLRMGLVLEEDLGRTLPEEMDVPEGIYSKVPFISRENWGKIKSYYLENSSDKAIPQSGRIAPEKGIPGFRVENVEFDFPFSNLITMVDVDSLGDIWLGHRYQRLFHLSSQKGFSIVDSIRTPVAPVQIKFGKEGFDLLTMGLMDPANDSLGVFQAYRKESENWNGSVVFDQLIRPVHVASGDLNSDGVVDYVISQFGNHIGKLSAFISSPTGYEEVIIKALPGARKVELVDMDEDGDLDLIGLMTQAQEGVFLWENDGKGHFVERPLIRFHPAFGGSDFQLVDINQDDKLDIVIANGDNADLSQQLKYYHGLRIFLNQDGQFKESWFYPMYGASGVVVEDFDQDGDLDLVAISFFPNEQDEEAEKLIYFENRGGLDLRPFVSQEKLESDFLIINKGDLDLDGDVDVLIGVFDFEDLYKKPSENWSPLILLRNNNLYKTQN